MRPSLVIAFPLSQDVVETAAQTFEVHYNGQVPLTSEQLLQLALAKSVDAMMVSMNQKVTAAFVDALPATVKVIATCSVGFDHLDLKAARAKGIMMTNVPDVLTDATADLTLLHILGACRRVQEYIRIMDKGWTRFFGQNEMLGRDASGKTLGILGMGRIGQAVAKRARSFGMKILYSNRKRLPADLESGAQYFANFREMLPHCHILSLHAPATPETQKIMNADTFALMPRGAVFINVARGSLVCEDALFEALKSGHLFAAGLDVFDNEPNINPKFSEFENVLLTPHMGSATRETRNAMGIRALANIARVLAHQPPQDPLF